MTRTILTALMMCLLGMVAPVASGQGTDVAMATSSVELDEQIARLETAASAAEARDTVQVATEEVMALIKRGLDYAEEDPVRFYTEVERLLAPVIDFPRFARSVMGVWYKQATPEQRQRFSDSFKWTLVRNYASALTQFHDGEVRVLPARRPSDGKRATVHMEIVYEGTPYSVVYAMQRRAERWQLVNVVIEGINLRLNYRSQFDSAMKGPEYDRDLEKVIEAWTSVITENAPESA